MGAPIIIARQFDILAKPDEIEAILEIGNGEWSRQVEFDGYEYTVLVSNRFTNARIEARKEWESEKPNSGMMVKYWTVAITPQAWGMMANDPLGFGKLPEDNVFVVYYPMSVEALPCVVIGWVEGFTFENRIHIKIKMRGYEKDSTYSLLCDLADLLIDELINYGIECRIPEPDNNFEAKGEEESKIQYIVQTNIYGPVNGPVVSGQFQSATAIAGGEAVDQRQAQGLLYKPQNTVEQNFNTKGDNEND